MVFSEGGCDFLEIRGGGTKRRGPHARPSTTLDIPRRRHCLRRFFSTEFCFFLVSFCRLRLSLILLVSSKYHWISRDGPYS